MTLKWKHVGQREMATKLVSILTSFACRSIANCRGSWVVGRSRGSWVWVKVVGNKNHLYTVSFPELDSKSLCVLCGQELVW